jgi:isopropylmalate/homocitrate/citramalate synthase
MSATGSHASIHASFARSIDLWDETLREGAERSPLSPTVSEKADLGAALSDIGIRTLVVGMFPDVPHNVELLRALLVRQRSGEIADNTKLVVISHLGSTLAETFSSLNGIGLPLDSVWVLGIHSASDLQIEHLYPAIRRKDTSDNFDFRRWGSLDIHARRAENLSWVAAQFERLAGFPSGGVAVGMLDAFRADPDHLIELGIRAELAGVTHARLVDTAGTCIPQQIDTHVRPVLARLPAMKFYGHFHNDFGLASGNALLGLSAGLAGVDVSVGGFANRAGHPALGEVVMALRMLYGIELPEFQPEQLCDLSRKTEKIYGLMESPTQPITGVVTHGILSGIRTQLMDKAPTIFDVIDPMTVGAQRDRLFGVRSGLDGMRRFLEDNSAQLGVPVEQLDDLSAPIFDLVLTTWQERTADSAAEIAATVAGYHALLKDSTALTEAEMTSIATSYIERRVYS